LKCLAQARGSLAQASPLRLGEGRKGEQWLPAPSRLGEPSLLEWDCGSLKRGRVAQATTRTRNQDELPLASPRQDVLAWARKLVLATVLSCDNHTNINPIAKMACSSSHSSTQTIKS